MVEIRDEAADYVFCGYWGYPNVASYMASYNLKGKEYRAKRNKWLDDNGYFLLKYNKLSTKGDRLFEKLCDLKEYLQVHRNAFECKIVERLIKKGYVSDTKEGYKWSTNKKIQTITDELIR